MKMFLYYRSIYDPRDVEIVEEDVEVKPILCEVCGKESTTAVVKFYNPTDVELPIEQCQQVMFFYCDEHKERQV